jgi:hypothetical protein
VGIPRTAAEAIAKAAAAAAKLSLLAPAAEPPPPRFPDVVVAVPGDTFQQRVIDTVALFVLDDGCSFEQVSTASAECNKVGRHGGCSPM